MERLRHPTIPILAESARGLFARACGNHNIPHSWMVLRHVGAIFRNRIDLSENDNLDLNTLGHILKIDEGELRARTYPLVASKRRSFFGMELSVLSFETRTRRFSPVALRDSSHMRAIWEIRDLPYCIEGWDILQTHCRCGVKQGWTRMTKVDRCDDCGRRLADRVEPIPVPAGYRSALSLPALLLSPLGEHQNLGRAMLPDQVARRERSTVYDTIIAISKALAPRANLNEWQRLEALHAASKSVLEWPDGMNDLSRPSWVAKGLWGRLRAKYDGLGSSHASSEGIELVGIRKAVAIGGTSRSILFKAREDGHLTEHKIRISGRGAFDAFDVAELQQFFRVYSDRLSLQEVAKATGLPLYAVDLIVATGRLPTNGIRWGDEDRFVSEADYCAFLQQLTDTQLKIRAKGALQDFTPMRLASQAIGGQLKPWGEIFSALLDGEIRFVLASGNAQLIRRISIHRSDVTTLKKLAATKPYTDDFPTTMTVHKQDALEILNISAASQVLAGLPFTQNGGKFHYELQAVLDRAEKTITLPEIAQRTGWSISRAFHTMRREKVPLLLEGCWCRETAEKHL